MRNMRAFLFSLAALAATTLTSGGCFNPDTGEGVEQSTNISDPNEECDGVDTDADGNIPAEEWDSDADGVMACAGDCNDLNPGINPGAAEVCSDGDDNDCDGAIDEGCDGDDDTTADDDSTPSDDDTTSQDDDSTPPEDDDTTPPVIDEDGDGYSPPSDCDDHNASIHPGAAELCDGLDTDCSGDIDPMESDEDGDGLTECDGDCWDIDPAVYPGAPEACDGYDQDCDLTNDGDEVDLDGDTYRPCAEDCDDLNPDVHPGAVETCDSVDQDCDSLVDNAPECGDSDGDGFTPADGDCDDSDPTINPGAAETCNGLDDNCDGDSDEGFNVDGDSYTTCAGDCDDHNPDIHPGVAEVCDGVDQDCDGTVDDGLEYDEYFIDADGDGYGNPVVETMSTCYGAPEGRVDIGSDCNDDPSTGANVHPGASESCDGWDEDCDGIVDEGFDTDRDGFTVCSGDCLDTNGGVHPGAIEVCNGLDDDCDAVADEGTECGDDDGDGYSEDEGDCDDSNASLNPNAEDIPYNLVDENCTGSDSTIMVEAFHGHLAKDGWALASDYDLYLWYGASKDGVTNVRYDATDLPTMSDDDDVVEVLIEAVDYFEPSGHPWVVVNLVADKDGDGLEEYWLNEDCDGWEFDSYSSEDGIPVTWAAYNRLDSGDCWVYLNGAAPSGSDVAMTQLAFQSEL